MRIQTRRCFTLVELLSVIVVIMMLIAFILPMLSRSRERTRQVDCANSLKQIGLAALSYAIDYDSYMPTLYASPTRSFEPLNELNYLNDGKTWNCPSRSVTMSTAHQSAYIYLASGWKDSSLSPTSDSMAHDEYDNHPGNEWSNVVYIDGHVDGGNPGRSLNFANQYADPIP